MNQVFKRLIFASIQMELKKMQRVFITKTQEVFEVLMYQDVVQ